MKTNKDVYETCPTFENDHYKLRLTKGAIFRIY